MEALKPKIFLWCVATGTGSEYVTGSTLGGEVIGYALSEDGEILASHVSSNRDYAKHDMGWTSGWKHDHYKEKYPNGYELVWVDDPHTDQEFQTAYNKGNCL